MFFTKVAATQGEDDCECANGLLHPNLILGLIIWLLILTLLVGINNKGHRVREEHTNVSPYEGYRPKVNGWTAAVNTGRITE